MLATRQKRRSRLTLEQHTKLMSRLASAKKPSATITPRPDQTTYPLSFSQERLWFLNELDPASPAYNRPMALRLVGELDPAGLNQALHQLIQHHQGLRATFHNDNGHPRQAIHPKPILNLNPVDLSYHANPLSAFEQHALQISHKPFDLTQPPLYRLQLYCLAPEQHILLIVCHHIIFDGWSGGLLPQQLSTLYHAITTNTSADFPDLSIQYADYAHWQRSQSARFAKQLAYWEKQLANLPTAVTLPTTKPRPGIQTIHGHTLTHTLPASLLAPLRQLAQESKASLFMVLLSAFHTLLHRYLGTSDIVTGSPVAGRPYPEVEPLLGFFINTLVLRSDLSGNPTFRELVAQVRQTALDGYANQAVPFEQVVQRLQPERDLSLTPLYQIMFNMEVLPPAGQQSTTLTITEHHFDTQIAQFDLAVELHKENDDLVCTYTYNRDLFEPDQITRLMHHYHTLLQGIAQNPDTPMGYLPLLTPAEHEQIDAWNDTTRPFPQDLTLLDHVSQQVSKTPTKAAFVFGKKRLSYQALQEQSTRLAHHLVALGTRPGDRIGLYLKRTHLAPIALLAIMKTGGIFVPFDPDHPTSRNQHILTDSDITLLLTDQAVPSQLAIPGLQTIDVTRLPGRVPTTPLPTLSPTDPIYTIYTSGSTGQPKGVVGTHNNALNGFHWLWQHYPFAPDDRCAQTSALNFIDAVWEIFGPLAKGIPSYIVPHHVYQNPHQLIAFVNRHKITRLAVTPSLLGLLLETNLSIPSLRLCMVSGEALPAGIAQAFHQQHPHATLFNYYGASEVADATYYEVQPHEHDPIPIGHPIANMQAHILDKRGQRLPIGIPGRLHISGPGLSLGYHNRPTLTAERFKNYELGRTNYEKNTPFIIPNSSFILYNTGDLAQYRADGQIEYLGRADTQINLRGFRIEPSEIESALNTHPHITNSLVLKRDEKLIAYIVNEASITPQELSAHLRQLVPAFMVPASYVSLPKFPLMANGKVNRLALPRPGTNTLTPQTSHTPATNPTEALLTRLWSDLLKVDRVGIHDNFFEIGGHSLLASKPRPLPN